jgi:hypothetical protein
VERVRDSEELATTDDDDDERRVESSASCLRSSDVVVSGAKSVDLLQKLASLFDIFSVSVFSER